MSTLYLCIVTHTELDFCKSRLHVLSTKSTGEYFLKKAASALQKSSCFTNALVAFCKKHILVLFAIENTTCCT